MFVKEFLQVFLLYAVYSLIVTVGQRVEFLAAAQELRHPGFRLQLTGSLKVDIVRMQGKRADDVIGIRVMPAPVSRGVVDGQQLDDLHASHDGPVDKAAQVAKVTHTKAMFRTQRKHRNSDTCRPPRLLSQSQMTAMQHQHLTVRQLPANVPVDVPVNIPVPVNVPVDVPVNVPVDVNLPIIAFFPGFEFMSSGIYHHIFIFYRKFPTKGIHRKHPFALACIVHQQITTGTPGA